MNTATESARSEPSLTEADTLNKGSSTAIRILNCVGLGVYSTLYFVLTCRVGKVRPLWTDEILTYDIARLPHLADIWAALSDGPDASPPLYHLTVRAANLMLGPGELA